MQKLILGYWKGRGVCHPIRQLLHIVGLPFEEVLYNNPTEWLADRPKVFPGGENAPFGNIPYIVDGDFTINESGALPHYICHKAGAPVLLGKNYKDQARLIQIQGVVGDLYAAFGPVILNENRTELVKDVVKNGSKTHALVVKLSEFLGKKKFILGYFTYADLLVSHFVLFLRNVYLSLGAHDLFASIGGGNLLALAKRVNALEELAHFNHNYPYMLAIFAPWFKEFPNPK